MTTYRVTVYDAANGRSNGRKGKSAGVYVSASSPEKAQQAAKRCNVHRLLPLIGPAREATPRELGCVTNEEGRAITEQMRAAWRKKYGNS